MKATCPMCGEDVTASQVEMEIAGRKFPVYQCLDCPKAEDKCSTIFALMPDGTKMNPDDVFVYLNNQRQGMTKTKNLKAIQKKRDPGAAQHSKLFRICGRDFNRGPERCRACAVCADIT